MTDTNISTKSCYKCSNCNKYYFFNDGDFNDMNCPVCSNELEYKYTFERCASVKFPKPYNPTKDPRSPHYVDIIRCPYCNSEKVKDLHKFSKNVPDELVKVLVSKLDKTYQCKSCRRKW